MWQHCIHFAKSNGTYGLVKLEKLLGVLSWIFILNSSSDILAMDIYWSWNLLSLYIFALCSLGRSYGSLWPFYCLSKHVQAFSGGRLQPVSDLQVDVPVSRPISLTQGRRNNLREDTHFHHCQLSVPGLHVHLVPCLKWPFCSLGPHCLLLKNSSLCLAKL